MKKNRNSPVHTNEESGKTDFIIDPLLPVGKENRISSSELVRLAGCGSVRELQKRIAWEREQGAIICSGCGAGYWRPALEDLLIQIAQAYIPNDDLIVRIPENEAEGELWSYEI